MVWVHLVVLLALVQLLVFIILVGKAREKFNVPAPATTGNVDFERYYRVQMNTIEITVIMIPAIILAATYWAPYLMAVLGFIHIIGRVLYFKAYTTAKNRAIPFFMSLIPILIFLLAGIAGTIRAIL